MIKGPTQNHIERNGKNLWVSSELGAHLLTTGVRDSGDHGFRIPLLVCCCNEELTMQD